MADSNASSVNYLLKSNQKDKQQSLCRHYLLSRPLPYGKQVYLALLQFVLLNVVGVTTEICFQVLLLRYYDTGAKSIPAYVFFRSFPLLLCLPMGFIADRYFGRAKVLYYSWIFLFVAQLLIALYFIIDAVAPYHDHKLVYITSVAVLINSISIAGIRVNLIPFGVDQMGAASSDQLSSYFHWYYWCRNVGQSIAYSLIASLVAYKNYVVALLISSTAAATGSVINILGFNWFIRKENVSNPLLLIYRVLKYAATAKRPRDRTAFSFDGRPEPSRIDLAKETHFGMYGDEKVEDVKTFLRMVVFLISLTGFLCVYSLLTNVYLEQSAFFQQPSFFLNFSNLSCPHGASHSKVYLHQVKSPFSSYWMVLVNNAAVLLMIILLDRVVYPLCCPVMLSMFRRIGIGMFVGLVTIMCAFTVELVRYYTLINSKSNHIAHINVIQSNKLFAVTIPVEVLIPQFVIQAVAECLVLVTIVEFIYAQSPAYMKGLLLGCLFSVEGAAMMLGSLLILSQSEGKSVVWEYLRAVPKTAKTDYLCQATIDAGSCLSAYVIIAFVTALGIVLFCFSAKHYKARIRGKALQYYM